MSKRKNNLNKDGRNSEQVWRENNPERFLWRTARDRAKKNGWQFTIRVDDIVIPARCPLLEIPLNTKKGRGRHQADCPSLDRYNSTLGYTEHNTHVISSLANTMKNDATAEQLDTFAKNQILKYASDKTKKAVYDKLRLEFGD